MTSSIEGFEKVFGKLHEIKSDKDIRRKPMESIKLETRVLSTPSEKWETLSFKILLNGKTEYVKCKKAPEKAELIDQIQGLKEGDMVSLVINPWVNNNTQKTSYYIDSIMPVIQLDPEREATEMAEGQFKKVDVTSEVKTSSYDRCNSMNASTALLTAIINANPNMEEKDLFEMHKSFVQQVKKEASTILDEFHG